MIHRWLQGLLSENDQHTRRVSTSRKKTRRLRIEPLEDRRMLSAEADIVFLVDKSASSGEEFSDPNVPNSPGWIGDIVYGTDGTDGLDAYLKDSTRDIDPRYGLIGFGDTTFARGQSLMLGGDKFFGTAGELNDLLKSVQNPGSLEFAWDGIEHGIAEYEFRDGAAVIFVLFRRDDIGGDVYDVGNYQTSGADFHTHEGILAAMESYNVTLNSVVEATFDPAMWDSVTEALSSGWRRTGRI
jgi:putative extracellular protein